MDHKLFAFNLDRLLNCRGQRGSNLAQYLNVTRQAVSQWRLCGAYPSDHTIARIAEFFACDVAELYEPIGKAETMMHITEWAKREGIPIGRAKDLFKLHILQGDRLSDWNAAIQLVPAALHAPPDSKRLVRQLTQPQPDWVTAFHVNLDRRMRHLKVSNAAMGKVTGVSQFAVSHWRSGRGYPLTERLETIAAKLNWTVKRLIAQPGATEIDRWHLRYGNDSEDASKVA